MLNVVDRPINFLSETLAVFAVAVAHAWQIAPLGMYFVVATLQVRDGVCLLVSANHPDLPGDWTWKVQERDFGDV